VLTINELELKKPPGILCTHCKPDVGCQIRENWPKLCQDFFCGWRYNATLGDEWRPDRSEILIELRDRTIPEGFAHAPFHYRFTLFGAPDKIYWMPLVRFIAALVGQNMPVIVAACGKPGYAAGELLVNEPLKPLVAARDLPQVATVLAAMLQLCLDRPQERIDPV
jgi:hypothetical protein